MPSSESIELTSLDLSRCRSWPYSQDHCVTCGLCASSCPVSGVDGFDPRKLIRLISLGLDKAAAESRWPWICTLCGKCENACPMEIEIADAVRKVRSLLDREQVPGILQQGLQAALETGNNLRLPTEDFVFILEDVAEEVAEEEGFENFSVSVDKKGARLLTTIHNKLVNTNTEDLKHCWKIFHAAGEDWTVSSVNWEGTSWGYFTGDDEAIKTMAGRIVEQMETLSINTLLWPE
ncbi:MAG: 4Fe-4S dicluster domain-containing protein [Desulfobacterales bacterium]|nr:4Fe-4S dicluster domain-containing protein [Desulfobacterales bacterium]